VAERRIFHHDLCFGCGQANLFGLQAELEPLPEGGVEGRFFVKQDHQGPPGFAHGGVIAAALDEAMALLLRSRGVSGLTARLEVDLLAPVSVGVFATVRARPVKEREQTLVLEATAAVEGEPVARARGVFVRRPDGAELPLDN
jgi:acyl-coenzyme A thioesterase PaaI-like protein